MLIRTQLIQIEDHCLYCGLLAEPDSGTRAQADSGALHRVCKGCASKIFKGIDPSKGS